MPPENTYDTKKILIFGIIVLAIAGLIGFLIFRKMSTTSTPTNDKNLFPYDGTTGITPTGSSTSSTGTIENPVSTTPITSTTSDRLRRITTYPVTAVFPFIQNKVSSEPILDPIKKQTVFVSKITPTNYVRFNAKQNGFLVDAEVTKNIITINQKTNVPILASEEVWFGNKGNTITYRSWDATRQSIASFNGSLPIPEQLGYCTQTFSTLFKTKSKGDEVKELQKYINQKLSLNLVIDGVYGQKIIAAVKPLQKILGLPETGTYDAALIQAINVDCAGIIAATVKKNEGIQKLTGDFLDSGILRGSVSPDGLSLFFLKAQSDGVVGIITDAQGKNPRKIFSSPLTEWRSQWVNATTIAMTTLASSEADGYLYFLNPTTGDFRKVLGPIRGLTTNISPDGNMVLFSTSSNRTLNLATYSISTGIILKRDLATLPEKCTWQNNLLVVCAVPSNLSNGQYPDDWYQGNVAFNDSFWSLDVQQGTTTNLISSNQKFDAYAITMSPNNSYFYFINKIDGTLWSYRLGEE